MGADWYERRRELKPGMVFATRHGAIVRLDQRTPGDGTNWDCDVWMAGRPDMPGTFYERGRWTAEGAEYHPGDLTERLPDDYAG